MSDNLEKFSIVLSGGGMRCAWSGGFLVALIDMGFEPSTIIAKSGNAGNAVYIATHQHEMIKRIWTVHLAGERFINWWRFWKIIDIDFLVDEVLSKKEPVDFNVLRISPIKVLIGCFNVSKQKIDYFSNRDTDFSVLKATKAMPIAYGKRISINGDLYTDKPFSPYQLLEDQREDLNKKVIMIDVREKSIFIQKMYKVVGDKTKAKESPLKDMLIIEPIDSKIHLLSRTKDVLGEAYNNGYLQALSQKDVLFSFLEKKNN